MKLLLALGLSFLSLPSFGASLTEELRDKASAASAKTPADKQAIMDEATAELRKKHVATKSPKVGEKLPLFTLPNAKGEKVSLESLLAKGPVILTFYRGSWCPYCNLQLRAYQRALPDFQKAGAQLVAVSPDKPEKAYETAMAEKLEFPVLSDDKNQVARKLGLVFTVPAKLKKLYKEFGIDLSANQGNDLWELPVPATYVVRPDRTIAYAFVDLDYKKRADPADILAALEKSKAR